MGFWALFNAEGNSNGTVETWEQDFVTGDVNLGNVSVDEAADWVLEEMSESASNGVVVSNNGTIEKWIMNSPAGEPRKWW